MTGVKMGQPAGVETEEPCIGRRAAARARLHAVATLQSISRDVRVIVRNLSCTGAMVEGPDLPPTGRTVLFKRDGIEEMATIVWTEDGRCGLEFFDPISHDEVVRQSRSLPERLETSPTPYYWRAGRDEGLSADEWHMAKALALKARH
jgi:hypothetical protein